MFPYAFMLPYTLVTIWLRTLVFGPSRPPSPVAPPAPALVKPAVAAARPGLRVVK